MNIEEIKNTLKEFQAQNDRKFKNTQAEFKKVVSYKKKSIYHFLSIFQTFSVGFSSLVTIFKPL